MKSFYSATFFYSYFRKLQIPPQLTNLNFNLCYCVERLVEIEVSLNNKLFTVIDKTFLVKKKSNKEFDTLVFYRRDVENIKILSHIKTINSNTFNKCNKLISITFDQEFLLESFENDAISSNSALKSIVFPPSLKYIIDGININYMLQYVEFQSEYFELKHT